MEIKRIEITKNIYNELKCVVNFAKDYYSTNHIESILLTEPNTLQTFEITNAQIVEAIGNHRKVYLNIKRKHFGLKYFYKVILILM